MSFRVFNSTRASRKTDSVHRIFGRLPLHDVKTFDLMTIKTLPDITPAQSCHRPLVSLACHLPTEMIFPVNPINIWITRDIFIKNDYCEVHCSAPPGISIEMPV